MAAKTRDGHGASASRPSAAGTLATRPGGCFSCRGRELWPHQPVASRRKPGWRQRGHVCCAARSQGALGSVGVSRAGADQNRRRPLCLCGRLQRVTGAQGGRLRGYCPEGQPRKRGGCARRATQCGTRMRRFCASGGYFGATSGLSRTVRVGEWGWAAGEGVPLVGAGVLDGDGSLPVGLEVRRG